MSLKNVVPPLPNGVRVSDKPADLEITCIRNAERWKPIIDTLKVIDATKCVEIDVNGLTKSKIQGMKTSLCRFAKISSYKPRLRFAVKNNTLYIWSNR